MAGIAQRGQGALMAMEIVQSGKALTKFREIIGAQGGDADVTPESIEVGQYKSDLKAPKDGYIAYISNTQLKSIAAALGCPTDKKSGVILHRKIGEFVKEGDVIMELFASREGALDHAIQIATTKSPFRQEGMVLERIGSGSIDLSQNVPSEER
jgi:AMP phosphorylase